jgi:hypothetical protein
VTDTTPTAQDIEEATATLVEHLRGYLFDLNDYAYPIMTGVVAANLERDSADPHERIRKVRAYITALHPAIRRLRDETPPGMTPKAASGEPAPDVHLLKLAGRSWCGGYDVRATTDRDKATCPACLVSEARREREADRITPTTRCPYCERTDVPHDGQAMDRHHSPSTHLCAGSGRPVRRVDAR